MACMIQVKRLHYVGDGVPFHYTILSRSPETGYNLPGLDLKTLLVSVASTRYTQVLCCRDETVKYHLFGYVDAVDCP
jgi:hypothetical protein